MSKGTVPVLPEKYPVQEEIYQHYKGDHYQIVGLAIHSNDDIWMVVYRPLYEDADAELFTRPLSEWFEEVTWNSAQVERFSLVRKG